MTGADLRVVDENCNPLPFFIQDCGNRHNNVLYVALPDLAQSGMVLQLYYGSRSNVSSAIDGSAVFLFFDDFEDGVVDRDVWENVGAYSRWDESDGKMHFVGDAGTGGIFQYITPKVAFKGPFTFDFAAPSNNNQVYGICDTADIDRVGFRYQSGSQSNDTMDIYVKLRDTVDGGFFTGDLYPKIEVERGYGNIMALSATIDPQKSLIMDRFENHTNGQINTSNLVVLDMEFDVIRPYFSSFGTSVELEYVGVRATPAGFPNVTFGPEVSLTTSAEDLIAQNAFECFPNPVINHLQFKYDKLSNVDITITNNLGKQVHSQSDLQPLDVSQWPAGWYIVKLKDGEKAISKKILVNK